MTSTSDQQPDETITDPAAGTLSDTDRQAFLEAQGLTAATLPEEADRIRAAWPDEDILMAIATGMW